MSKGQVWVDMLESRITRPPARGKPMVLAVFSYRYDAHLVPGLLQNLAPAVHGHVAWNDTGAAAALTPEPERRQHLLSEARRLGADWILAVDPDERFEDRLAQRMSDLLTERGTLWTFPLREMVTPDSYRTDGVWGGKTLMRLFPAGAAHNLTAGLHGNWVEDTSGYDLRNARLNLYHLRMASPVRRRLRRELYAAADPTRQFQQIGYDYLDDDRGMRLERIPDGRGFSPPFVEDHGAWSPAPADVGLIQPDALEQLLHFAAQSARRQGHAAAAHVLEDLAAASPQDEDLPILAACHAATAGLDDLARAKAEAILARRPADLLARRVLARAFVHLGQSKDAEATARGLPEGPLVRQLQAEIDRPTADFAAPDARWRRWINSAATCIEGAANLRSDIAVVVIGFRAQEDLAGAVASVLRQDPVAEVVVVNSGGGDVRGMLAPWLGHIRLIEVEEPLYVGAARNIGIDASRAEFVAFLAGDCQAEPGWVAGRLARHRAGAWSVATPVLPQSGAGVVAEAANRLLYWGRRPDTPQGDVLLFGRSYHRRIFGAAGYFPTGLRVAEDDRMNARADRMAHAVWAPEVRTRHRDTESLVAVLRAQGRRGENRADHGPFRAMAGAPDRAARLGAAMQGRLRASLRAMGNDPGLSPLRRGLMALVQRLTNRADGRGVARGLNRIARAAALAEAGTEGLRQATYLDPQDWRLALRLGTALAEAGDPAAEAEFRRGLALAPGAAALLEGLVSHLHARGKGGRALEVAEEAALMSPLTSRLWRIASDEAERAGHLELALAHARQALALGLDQPGLHRRVAALHQAKGDPVAAVFREHCAKRLETDAARRRD